MFYKLGVITCNGWLHAGYCYYKPYSTVQKINSILKKNKQTNQNNCGMSGTAPLANRVSADTE